MATEYCRSILRVSLAQICQQLGWQCIHSTPLEILTDVMERYISEVAKTTHRYSEQFGRTEPNLDDLGLAFKDIGMTITELQDYVKNFDSLPCPITVPEFPLPVPNRLNFPPKNSKEVLQRIEDEDKEHIYEHLPLVNPDPEDAADDQVVENGNQTESPDGSTVEKLLKRKLTSPDEPPNKKHRSLPEEAAPSYYEMASVVMTHTGFVSPVRPGQGKLPDPSTPPQARCELSKKMERSKVDKFAKEIKASQPKDSSDNEITTHPPSRSLSKSPKPGTHRHVSPKPKSKSPKVGSASLRALLTVPGSKQVTKDPVENQIGHESPDDAESVGEYKEASNTISDVIELDDKDDVMNLEDIDDTIDSVIKQAMDVSDQSVIEDDNNVIHNSSTDDKGLTGRTAVDDSIDSVLYSLSQTPDPYDFDDENKPLLIVSAQPTTTSPPVLKPPIASKSPKQAIIKKKMKKPKLKEAVISGKTKSEKKEQRKKMRTEEKVKSLTMSSVTPMPSVTSETVSMSSEIVPQELDSSPKAAPITNWPRVSLERLTPEDMNMKFEFTPRVHEEENVIKEEEVERVTPVVQHIPDKVPTAESVHKDRREHRENKEKSKEHKKEKKEKKKKKDKEKDRDKEKRKDKHRDKEDRKDNEDKHKTKQEVPVAAFVPKLTFKFGGGASSNVTVTSQACPDDIPAKQDSSRPDIPKLVIKSVRPPVSPSQDKPQPLPELPPSKRERELEMSKKSKKKIVSPSRTKAPPPPASTEVGVATPVATVRSTSSPVQSLAAPPVVAHKTSGSVARTVMTETISTVGNDVTKQVSDKLWICPACRLPDDGSPMVGCDLCDDWYHWPCVGITVEPDVEEWFCSKCDPDIKNDKNKGKKKKKKKHRAE